MLLQERVNVRKVPDVPGKTIQLIDYQDIAEATLYKRQHTLQIRPGRIRTSEVFIREVSQMKMLRKQGFTIREIAEKMNRSESSIKYKLYGREKSNGRS